MPEITVQIQVKTTDWEQQTRQLPDLPTAVASFRQALEQAGVGSMMAAAAMAHHPVIQAQAEEERQRQMAALRAHYGPYKPIYQEYARLLDRQGLELQALERNRRRRRPGNLMRRKLARLRRVL